MFTRGRRDINLTLLLSSRLNTDGIYVEESKI